ncbi:glycosyltransferase family 2 protein [Streptomyces sp. NBC_00006]|uniref:glycosyltransferase family 2 protein n=1 Tax=Streptomyces sp. NBC_00006 TaxID=2975619 RepID=UPI00225AEB7D|nr:glycosyltransferase family A protein [Streptomyces sp. NBC_00006]MCX5535283.1 glycosyltransferase family 2 protein [Streptomyces sp. NBC_00006]
MRTETVSGGPRPADVSVLLAVRNGMPELGTCLKSLGRQTLASERMEVIVVDDASTDTSAGEAEAFASGAGCPVRVVRRETAAAVPGLVRNQALAQATGRYVLFLGSADRLGDEALERLLATADRDDSDVVVGKVAGGGLRGFEKQAFKAKPGEEGARAQALRHLGVMKLFRRELLSRNDIRFDASLCGGDDVVFVTQAVAAADRVSFVSDYVCCRIGQAREPEDGVVPYACDCAERSLPFFRAAAAVAKRARSQVETERMLSVLLAHHIDEMLSVVDSDASYNERQSAVLEMQRMRRAYWTNGVGRRVGLYPGLCSFAAARGLFDEVCYLAVNRRFSHRARTVVEGNRVYRAFPFFRAHRGPGNLLPDHVFECTDRLRARGELLQAVLSGPTKVVLSGFGYVGSLDSSKCTVTLHLRRRGGGGALVLPVEPSPTPFLTRERGDGVHDYDDAGWRAEVDFDRVDWSRKKHGPWDFWVIVSSAGMAKEARLKAPASVGRALDNGLFTGNDSTRVRVYRTPGGYLACEISAAAGGGGSR